MRVPRANRKTVAVFGAGVAGLTVAHELARRGHQVSVYEANAEAGGFFRSARLPRDGGMPSEYSWHGLGPWYHNVFDVMKQIPFDQTGSVYDKALSRPLAYGVVPDEVGPGFDDSCVFDTPKKFRLSRLDVLRWKWLMLLTWSAHRRTTELYARLSASEQWKAVLTELGWKTWRACFGPWIGSDWTRVSLHHAGLFFRRNLMSGPRHAHPADDEGPAWTHGSGDGWLLLRGPSSEFWFRPWIAHLEERGVRFAWSQPLRELEFDGERIAAARLESGISVEADVYVLATNPFAAADILSRTSALEAKDPLHLFRPLVQDGPHTQVSFRLAFADRIAWPRPRSAFVIADSEFNLTLFAEEQAWKPSVDLGPGVGSLWTGTACSGTVPGRLYGLPMVNCTKEQFLREVEAQLLGCQGLDVLLRALNGGRGLRDFRLLRMEVWHEWRFSPEGIEPRQPKWVTSTNTQPYLPTQTTSVDNLLLAGAHTKTAADVWSIEAAVESGRWAARAIDPLVGVLPQHKAWWLRALGAADDLCFAGGLPHVLGLVAGIVLFALLVLAAATWATGWMS